MKTGGSDVDYSKDANENTECNSPVPISCAKDANYQKANGYADGCGGPNITVFNY
jgi:hypothetical protein